MSVEEENKALVRHFLEEQAKGNLDVIDELLSPNFVDRSLLPGQGPTREDFKRTNKEILDAFSTISFTIEEQIAEGDTVITKYRHRLVSRGEFAGLRPTGKIQSKAFSSTVYPGAGSPRSGARLMLCRSGTTSCRKYASASASSRTLG
jgi:ketosteroid isomerase-like protein